MILLSGTLLTNGENSSDQKELSLHGIHSDWLDAVTDEVCAYATQRRRFIPNRPDAAVAAAAVVDEVQVVTDMMLCKANACVRLLLPVFVS